MDNEFTTDLITLVDDEGTEHEFEILDIIDNEDGCFYALLPNFESPDESLDFSGTYFVFQEIEENGEKLLTEIEDDALLDRLANTFESRFEKFYEDESSGDDSLTQ